MILGGIVVIILILQFLIPHLLPAVFTTIAKPFWRMEFSGIFLTVLSAKETFFKPKADLNLMRE